MSLAWKLRRLGAMSPGEVLGRAAVSMRDRLAPPAYARLTPDQAAARLFADPAAALDDNRAIARLRVPDHAEGLEGTVSAARALASGRWQVFGNEVRLDDPPAWSRHPVTGQSWPELPSHALDHRRNDLAGGAKAVWELGRLTMLPTLALAARVTGEDAHAARAARWLADFTARNPAGHGIHHTSGIEMAVRVLTGTVTLALLPAATRAGLAPALGLLAQQASWCRDHRSLGSSANNHLIAEYAAMTVLGAAFPRAHGARDLLVEGHAGLARETLRQIHTDGVPAEQAFGYLPFVWELLLLPLMLAEDAGLATPAPVRTRLAASLEFARAVRRTDGTPPPIGDDDDGRILLADENAPRLDLVGDALAAWLGGDGLSGGSAPLARLLTGRVPAGRRAEDGRHAFAAGGYTVWRHGPQLVTFDHGPLGLGTLAAHGHADALSVTIGWDGDVLVADPGTLAYQEDAQARERCRSTPVHSTVHFGGRSQSEMLGPFLWGRRARVQGNACEWVSGERHERTVTAESGRVTVDDRVWGANAELVFALAPGAEVRLDGTRAHVVSGACAGVFEGLGIAPWRVASGEVAPRFSRRQPAVRLVASLGDEHCRTTISAGPR
jgi:hypothetical protein